MDKQQTKYIFASAMKILMTKKPLDKITVSDIVEKSGMTRQTFYRHFQDKYDLMNWYFKKLVVSSFEKMNEGGTIKEALMLKFEFIQKEHPFFKEAFKSNDYNLIQFDFACIYDFYKTMIENNIQGQINQEIDFLLKMYCNGSVDMTVDWILSDMAISIDSITNLLIEALPERLKEYIK